MNYFSILRLHDNNEEVFAVPPNVLPRQNSALSDNIALRMDIAKANREMREMQDQEPVENSLRMEELYELLQSLGLDYDWDECVQMFHEYDSPRSGSLCKFRGYISTFRIFFSLNIRDFKSAVLCSWKRNLTHSHLVLRCILKSSIIFRFSWLYNDHCF